MIPEGRTGERGVRKLRVADEASGGMGIEGEKERDKEVVGVPECFVRLLADSDVGGREHHEHAEQHYVTGYAAGLSVVYLHCCLRSYLVPFNIKEASYVSEAYNMNRWR